MKRVPHGAARHLDLIDLLVIGAGPAGNNAAYKLASLGYDVVVADWRHRIGDKLCTGIVGKECIDRYPIDPSLILRSAQSAQIATPNGQTTEFAGDEVQAYVVDRVGYIDSMAEQAKRAGATYMLGSRATGISVEKDRCRVRFASESGQRTIEAKAVALASGFGSELNNKAGLGKPGDHVTAVQAEVQAPGINQITVYVGQSVAPGFFAWLAPTKKDRALVGLLSRHRAQDHMDNLIRQLHQDGRIAGVIREPSRWGIPLRPPRKTYGHRILAVGDAAGQVKPTTGGGIYYALLSSDVAADTLHQAFKQGDLSSSFLSTYERQWKALLSKELEVGYLARRFFESLDDHQISSLVEAMGRNGLSAQLMDSRQITFDRAISKVISYPLFGKALTLINPLLATLAPHDAGPSPSQPD